MQELKNKVSKGFLWSSIERFSIQGIQFIVGIVIARILSPHDYGMVGMVVVFLAISQVFIDSGFSTALIQKKDRNETDYSTVFYFNIILGILFYLLLFVTAPLIARFYNQPELVNITRVLGINVFLISLAVVQRAKLTVVVDFKTQAKAGFIAVSLSGITGIILAYRGYGVWALVIQTLLNNLLNTAFLWLYSRWVPLFVFSIRSFRHLFAFGSKLLGAGILDTVYKNIYPLIIGKLFSSAELGYYTRADQFCQMPSSNLTGIIQRVTFPVLCDLQEDEVRLKEVYRKFIQMSALLIFPLMSGLAALSFPAIRLVLTDKWLPSAPLLQLLCLAGMLYPIHALNLNLLNVKGRSDLFLRLEIVKKLILTAAILLTFQAGVQMMIIGQVVTSYIILFINTYYTKKLIGYGIKDQIKDLSTIFLLSAGAALLAWSITFLSIADIFKLIFGSFAGIGFYLGIACYFNIGHIKEIGQFIIKKK